MNDIYANLEEEVEKEFAEIKATYPVNPLPRKPKRPTGPNRKTREKLEAAKSINGPVTITIVITITGIDS
jgi:hypothetical protein